MHFVFHGIIYHFTVFPKFHAKVISKDNFLQHHWNINYPKLAKLQFWFTVLQDLLLTEAFIISSNADNSYHLSDSF